MSKKLLSGGGGGGFVGLLKFQAGDKSRGGLLEFLMFLRLRILAYVLRYYILSSLAPQGS